MLTDLAELHRPTELAEALRLLARARPHTVPLGGGTTLAGGPGPGVEALVDLSALGLDGVGVEGSDLVLGATTTLQALSDDPLVRRLWWGVLATAARVSASHLLRNAATLGGTLATGPAARADLGVVLLALEARVRALGPDGQERWLAMAELAGGLPAPALLMEVRVPGADGPDRAATPTDPGASTLGAAFARVARTAGDLALVHAAAVVESTPGHGSRVRLAVGGVDWPPARLPGAEAALDGVELTDAAIEAAAGAGVAALAPPGDHRASSGYRTAVAAVLLRRAVRQAADRAVAVRFHPAIGANG